jgi:hypothetical protein
MSTYYKQERSNGIINLDSTDDAAETMFKLKSPPKGKVYRGPNWTAYNRENLGSIPSNIENILIKDNESKKLGFSSNSIRFNSKIDALNSSSPGPGTYYSVREINNPNKPSFSSKGYGTGFCSTKDRFDDLKEFTEKYRPGPGQYKFNDFSTISTDVSKSLSYRSMYTDRQHKSLKVQKSSPGPGEYNPINYMNKNSNKEGLNYFFRNEIARFKETIQKEVFPGPGKYFESEGSELLKDNKEGESRFFKKPTLTIQEKDIEAKYFKKDKFPSKFTVPGVGTYNLRGKIGNSYEKNMPYQIQKINDSEPPKIEENLPNLKNDFYEFKTSFDCKNAISSVFVSKSPKIKKIEKYGVPGPTYYKPQVIPKKLNFNFNIDNTWI